MGDPLSGSPGVRPRGPCPEQQRVDTAGPRDLGHGSGGPADWGPVPEGSGGLSSWGPGAGWGWLCFWGRRGVLQRQGECTGEPRSHKIKEEAEDRGAKQSFP